MAVPLAARRPGLERAEARARALAPVPYGRGKRWQEAAAWALGAHREPSLVHGHLQAATTEEGHAPAGRRPHVSGSRPVCGEAEPRRRALPGRQRFSKACVPRREPRKAGEKAAASYFPTSLDSLIFSGVELFCLMGLPTSFEGFSVLKMHDCVFGPQLPTFSFLEENKPIDNF